MRTEASGAATPSLRLRVRRLWRTDLRARWLSIRLPLLGVAAVAVLVMGYVGFAELDPPIPGQNSFWDRLQLSMQLFVLQSGARRQDVNVWLDVARLLAPIVAGTAAILAVVALFREQLQIAYSRLFHGHVVVAGLSEKGLQLLKALHDQGRRIVVIERNPANPLIGDCQQLGVAVVRGDAGERIPLRRAGVTRARDLVVTCGDDATNVSVAFSAGRVVADRSGVLTATVHLDDRELWPLLTAEILARRERTRLRLAPFNLDDVAARALLDDHSPLEAARPHLLIIGVGGLSEWLVLQAARRWSHDPRRAGGDLLHVTVADVRASAWCSSLCGRHPRLSGICQLTRHDADVADSELDWTSVLAPVERPITHAYITLPSEADGLAAAIALHARGRTARLPVILVVKDEQAGVATALTSGGLLEGVQAFGVLSGSMTPRLLAMTPNEVLARAAHDAYFDAQIAKGDTPVRNSSLRPFDELEESVKEQNRRFADAIGEKLAVLKATLLPAPLADLNGEQRFEISKSELDKLAELEHERWCRDLTDDGWKWGESKDPIRKLHPNLVPWRDLSDDDRAKDEVAVSALPGILARAGFDIVRTGPSNGDADVVA